MKIGDVITLRAYGDEIIRRRVVDFNHRMVWICTDEEYATARTEGREPQSVGFRVTDIVDEGRTG